MPINKDAMARYRIIDKMLSDPDQDYTTKKIMERVLREYPSHKVSLRMIQKDIKALEDNFGKELVRNAGGKGTVRYKDQSTPLFYQELSVDDEELLREVLRFLGRFDGLDNFKWIEILRKKLAVEPAKGRRPAIYFFTNDILQFKRNILGRLLTAILHKKVVRFGYKKFIDRDYTATTAYPYQLRQYNDRWFLLANPVGNSEYPFDPGKLFTYALDRMDGNVEYIDDMPYVDTGIDIEGRSDEIVGVTYRSDTPLETIYFAVRPESVDYVRTKFIHPSQDEVNPETEKELKLRYPSVRDCAIFIINCRPNYELYSRLSSYGSALIVLEPHSVREKLYGRFSAAARNYEDLG